MNKDLIILVMFCAIMYLFYEVDKLKNRENFNDASTAAASLTAQINTAVKKIYLADVEAIRLLSNFAIQLSQGGTTIPGNVNFTGSVRIGNWAIEELSNGYLRFYKIGQPNNNYIYFSADGNIEFTGRDGIGGWLVHNLKLLRDDIDKCTKKGDNIQIGNWVIQPANGHLTFTTGTGLNFGNYYDMAPNTGFIAMSTGGDIWTTGVHRNWLSNTIKDISDNSVRTDKYYGILGNWWNDVVGSGGAYLNDEGDFGGGGNNRCAMKFNLLPI